MSSEKIEHKNNLTKESNDEANSLEKKFQKRRRKKLIDNENEDYQNIKKEFDLTKKEGISELNLV